jgi:hypothetical protein
VLQLLKQPGLPLPRTRLTVARCLDGTLRIEHRGREFAFEDVTETRRHALRRAPETKQAVQRTPVPPAAAHPWRQGLPPMNERYAAANYNSQATKYSASP